MEEREQISGKEKTNRQEQNGKVVSSTVNGVYKGSSGCTVLPTLSKRERGREQEETWRKREREGGEGRKGEKRDERGRRKRRRNRERESEGKGITLMNCLCLISGRCGHALLYSEISGICTVWPPNSTK